jgi:hypothetical protein
VRQSILDGMETRRQSGVRLGCDMGPILWKE